MRECWVRGRDDLLLRGWPLVNFKKLSNLNMRQNFSSSILWVWEKYWKFIFFKNNWTSPPTFVFASLSDAKILKFNFVKFCQNYLWKYAPARILFHQSSTLASILLRNIWNCKTRELRLNFSTLQQTCMIVYETLVCQRRWWPRRRGGARPAAQQHLCFQSLQGSEEVRPSHTAQIARNLSKLFFALFLTSLRNVTIIMSSISPILATFFNIPWKDKWK